MISSLLSYQDDVSYSISKCIVDVFRPRGDVTFAWWLSAIAMAALTITTVAGNAAVVRALRRARRSPTHYPLISLAAADMLVGTCVLPIAAARELFVFHLNWAICACWSTLDVLCCTASIVSLCALGWERWCGITAPLARAKRARFAKIFAYLVWPISTAIALPTAFIPSPRHYYAGEMAKACTVNTNIGYVFFSVTFSFYIPTSVMVVLYARILRSLAVPPPIRAHRGRRRTLFAPKGNADPSTEKTECCTPKLERKDTDIGTACTSTNGCHLQPPNEPKEAVPMPSPLKKSNSPGGIIPRQRRATRTIVMLMSLFLICWTPFFVMLPIDSLCGCVSDVAWQWCTWLGYANSAFNPLVYAASSPTVRRALRASLPTITSSTGSGVRNSNTDAPMATSVKRT